MICLKTRSAMAGVLACGPAKALLAESGPAAPWSSMARFS
jgi:hypothetical protein